MDRKTFKNTKKNMEVFAIEKDCKKVKKKKKKEKKKVGERKKEKIKEENSLENYRGKFGKLSDIKR